VVLRVEDRALGGFKNAPQLLLHHVSPRLISVYIIEGAGFILETELEIFSLKI
jgi:hypothetical protein